MAALHELSAIELARLIADGGVSSREALTHFVDRVDRLDGPLNAVVTRDLDAAFAAADRADPATAGGEELPPLHGVPMTVKDSFSTAGMRTTSGAPELADHVPTEDAAPVAAVRRAGAVDLGQDEPADLRRRHAELQRGLRHDRQPVGPRAHPGRLVRRFGGGAGGAVHAARDRLGHRRLDPAAVHMSGVFGHKPSYGIVPAHGQIPGPPGTLTQADIAVAGPMARTADDLALALDLMSGPDRWNHPAWRLELPPPRATDLGRLPHRHVVRRSGLPARSRGRRLRCTASSTRSTPPAAASSAEATPGFDLDQGRRCASTPLVTAAISGGYSPAQIEEFAARHRRRPGGGHQARHEHAPPPVAVAQREPPAAAPPVRGVLRGPRRPAAAGDAVRGDPPRPHRADRGARRDDPARARARTGRSTAGWPRPACASCRRP